MAQTYRPLEVVVVDDGSTDDSVEIMRSYGNRIRAVFKKNEGQGSAINAGYANSTGEIIALLDADDYLKPAAMEVVVAHWKDDTNILFHRVEVVDASGRTLDFIPPARYDLESGDVVPLLLRQGGYACPPTSGMTYSRRVLAKVLPMPNSPWQICADAYLAITTPFFSQVEVLGTALAYYRMHGSNLHGPTITTRHLLNRRKMKRDIRNEVIRSLLLKKWAAARGKTGPVSFIYFNKLLLYRASSRFYKIKRGGVLYVTMLKNTWLGRRTAKFEMFWQKPLVGLIILFAPRSILRRIYPTMFADSGT